MIIIRLKWKYIPPGYLLVLGETLRTIQGEIFEINLKKTTPSFWYLSSYSDQSTYVTNNGITADIQKIKCPMLILSFWAVVLFTFDFRSFHPWFFFLWQRDAFSGVPLACWSWVGHGLRWADLRSWPRKGQVYEENFFPQNLFVFVAESAARKTSNLKVPG